MPLETADTVEAGDGTSESTPVDGGDDTSTSIETGDPTPGDPSDNEAGNEGDGNGEGGEESGDESLISDEDFEKLQDDPAELRKALQGAFTKKTQALGPARQLMASLAKDPKAVVAALAKAAGMTISANPSIEAVKTAEQELTEKFTEILGGAEAAKALMPGFKKLIDEQLAPLKDAHQKQMVKAVSEHAAIVEKSFTKQRPDWKKHEAKMMEIAKTITPSQGVDPVEYLDTLYTLATQDTAVRRRAEALVNRINKSAKSVSDSRVTGAGAAATSVRSDRPKRPSIRQAAEAAMRGERYDD